MPELSVSYASVEQRLEFKREKFREGSVNRRANTVNEADLHLGQFAHLIPVHEIDRFNMKLVFFNIACMPRDDQTRDK